MIHPRDLEGEVATKEERALARYWSGVRVKPPRALSLVPAEANAWFHLVETLYLPLPAIRARREQFKDHRAISHAQIELIASRVSILNDCSFCASTHMKFLRTCGLATGETYNIDMARGAPGDGNIPHGGLLVAFTDAVMGENEESISSIRSELRMKMGDAALVDAAGVLAAFNSVNRVANSIGLRTGRRAEKAAAVGR
jgi:AhpD family alkylhydroperoxidase